MNIAEQKKADNISEYIIHIYQSEDLIRAYQFDIEELSKYVIGNMPLDEEAKTSLKQWYKNLSETMGKEGVKEHGHIKETQGLIDTLTALHEKLLKADDTYKDIYKNAKESIQDMLKLAEGKITNEIQVCLNGIYGMLLLRMNGKKIPEEFQSKLEKFGDVLSYLSFKYKEGEEK